MRALLLTGILALVCAQPVTSQLFSDATVASGLTATGSYFSAVWGDVDHDGDFDLFVASGTYGEESLLYTNNGDGTFTLRQTGPVASLRSRATFGKWVDWNGDGDLDLFVSALSGPLQLLDNDGTGQFEVVQDPAVESIHDVRRLGIADYDGDGDVDLVASRRGGMGNVLLRNENGERFQRITNGPIAQDQGNSTCVEFADIDGDADQDLLVCNSGERNFLYENVGGGAFVRRTDTALTRTESRTGDSAWADFDGDGDVDLYVTNVASQQNEYYRNDGDWAFEQIRTGIHVEEYASSNSSAVADFDNDGDLDIYVANTDRENFLYTNLGDGTFRKIEFDDSAVQRNASFHASAADSDGDGDPDLFVSNVEQDDPVMNRFYLNGTFGNNWLHVRLDGRGLNTAGVGARITARAEISGERHLQIRDMTEGSGTAGGSGTVMFGLGDAVSADSVTVSWPSGTIQTFNSVEANVVARFSEPRIDVALDAPTAGRPDGPLQFHLTANSEDGPPVRAWLHFRSVGEDSYFRTQFVGQTPASFEAGVRAGRNDIEYFVEVEFDRYIRRVGSPGQPRRVEIFQAPPRIESVADVPFDDGGHVQIVWLASVLDVDRKLLPGYSIWRSISDAGSPGQTMSASFVLAAESGNPVNYRGRIWEWIADLPSLRLDRYAYTVETLYDRSPTTDGTHWFMVVAHTDDPNVFFASDPVSGYSLDNGAADGHHTDVIAGDADVPTAYSVDGNYPNPFSRSTYLRVSVPRPVNVTVRVVDLLGRVVKTHEFQVSGAGRYEIPIEFGEANPAGTYVATVAAEGRTVASGTLVKAH